MIEDPEEDKEDDEELENVEEEVEEFVYVEIINQILAAVGELPLTDVTSTARLESGFISLTAGIWYKPSDGKAVGSGPITI